MGGGGGGGGGHTSSGVGVGGGAGGGSGTPPPSVLSSVNCDPQLNNAGAATSNASGDAGDPPVNTSGLIIGTNKAASAAGPSGNAQPAVFFGAALANLGLVAGKAGNAGYSASDLAQVSSTIATYDQVENDVAGIIATIDVGNPSTNLTRDANLLKQVDGRLQAVTNAENLLFGTDANWLNTRQVSTLQQWLTQFYTDFESSSDGSISAAEEAQLLAMTLPTSLNTTEASKFLDRWNRTVQYWGQGIFTASQVPSGQSTAFLDINAIQSAFNTALTAEEQSQINGYADPLAEMQVALTTVRNDIQDAGVCATIKLQIDQTATMTRSAFTGTLTIDNSEESGSLTNVMMNITITDAEGSPANGEFFVSSPTYSGAFSVVNGNATLPDNATGTIQFTFIPDDKAATSGPTLYDIGGTFSFTDPSGGNVSIPVFPTTITVYPQAKLKLNYFLQRDVIGEDPFNPHENIPSEPAVLGLLVTNTGLGTANNLSISTGQPQIIENQKGLLDTFTIVGTKVGNQQESPSLDVNFGNVAPGQTGDAEFLLTSTLQGIFENFTASFTHSDALGGLDTSLISSVTTHTLIHAGDFQYAGESSYPGETSYLAEDNANPGNLPDTIYFSDGTTAPVNIATNVASSPTASAGVYTVSANVTSGWDYIQLPDPGAGYTLYQVVRSDGVVVPVSDQAWTTDRTFNAVGSATTDDELHILDDNSTGSYTAYYKPTTVTAPRVASIEQIASPQSGPVDSLQVTFNEAIDPATFTNQALSLTLNGGANLIDPVTITEDSPTTFTIGGLSRLTTAEGNYVFSVDASTVSDPFGDVGTGSFTTSWATGTDVPVVVSVGAGEPAGRNTALDSLDVVLSEPIVPATFDDAALTLTLDGGTSNLITSAVTVTQLNDTTYSIGGLSALTAADGTYTLTVSPANLVDAAGNQGVGSQSLIWTKNTVGPTIVALEPVTQSPRNIIVPTLTVTFSEPIDPATFTPDDVTYSKDGGANLVTSAVTITQLSPVEFQVGNFNDDLPVPVDGDYTFTVNAADIQDLVGNSGNGSASDTWTLITTAPNGPRNLAISPDTGISSTDGTTDAQNVTLTGNVDQTGLLVDVYDGFNELVSDAPISGETISENLTLAQGAHTLSVEVVDAAGNVSSASTLNVF
ncbi:MAG TPA: Ig-like domain-containing protein, partial [Pirellulales bacterium]|nr:Ig-like domain-containing protein [Pirellulales bacterium]